VPGTLGSIWLWLRPDFDGERLSRIRFRRARRDASWRSYVAAAAGRNDGGAESPLPAERQLAWQLAAARLLTDLLAQAASKGLPVLAWEIGEVGSRASGLLSRNPVAGASADLRCPGHLDTAHPPTGLNKQHIADLTQLMAE
jgi:hypothetical protein